MSILMSLTQKSVSLRCDEGSLCFLNASGGQMRGESVGGDVIEDTQMHPLQKCFYLQCIKEVQCTAGTDQSWFKKIKTFSFLVI